MLNLNDCLNSSNNLLKCNSVNNNASQLQNKSKYYGLFLKTKLLFQTVNLASIEQRKCGFTNVLGQVSMWNNQCSL